MLLETALGIVKFLKSRTIITVRANVNKHHLREKQNEVTDALYDYGAALLVSHHLQGSENNFISQDCPRFLVNLPFKMKITPLPKNITLNALRCSEKISILPSTALQIKGEPLYKGHLDTLIPANCSSLTSTVSCICIPRLLKQMLTFLVKTHIQPASNQWC